MKQIDNSKAIEGINVKIIFNFYSAIIYNIVISFTAKFEPDRAKRNPVISW